MSKRSGKSSRGFKARGAFGIPRYRRNSVPTIDRPEIKFGFFLRLKIWIRKMIRRLTNAR